MRDLIIVVGLGLVVGAVGACGKSSPPATGGATVPAASAPSAAASGVDAVDAGGAGASAGGAAAKEDPNEAFRVVLDKGKVALKGAQRERFEILTQAEDLKFDEAHKAQADAFKALKKKLEDFAIGENAAELATAAKRVCALIEDVRVGAQKLVDDGNVEIKSIDDQQKELEAKQKDGGKVSQATWDKLDDAKQTVSVPVLAARHIFLALKTILNESLTLVEMGPRQTHLEFKECLGAIAKNPISFELTQGQLQKVLERVNYFSALE
jgi:hypothetical protein